MHVFVVDDHRRLVTGEDVAARFSYASVPDTVSHQFTDAEGHAEFLRGHPEPLYMQIVVRGTSCGPYPIEAEATYTLVEISQCRQRRAGARLSDTRTPSCCQSHAGRAGGRTVTRRQEPFDNRKQRPLRPYRGHGRRARARPFSVDGSGVQNTPQTAAARPNGAAA